MNRSDLYFLEESVGVLTCFGFEEGEIQGEMNWGHATLWGWKGCCYRSLIGLGNLI